jgi:hypothetical protein
MSKAVQKLEEQLRQIIEQSKDNGNAGEVQRGIAAIMQELELLKAKSERLDTVLNQKINELMKRVDGMSLGLFSLLLPQDKAVIPGPTNLVFSWEPSARAAAYELVLRNAANQEQRYAASVPTCMVPLEPGAYTFSVEALSAQKGRRGSEGSPRQVVISRPLGSFRLVDPGQSVSAAVPGPVVFSWTPADNAGEYELRVRDPKGEIKREKIKERTSLPLTLEASGHYSWTVVARGDHGEGVRSPENQSLEFNVIGPIRLVSPDDRALLGAGPVQFAWESTEQASNYRLDIEKPDGQKETQSTTAISAVVQLSAPGDYRWTVTALDAAGKELSTKGGAGRLLKVVGGFQLLTPKDSASLKPGEVNFAWSAAANVGEYEFTLEREGEVCQRVTVASPGTAVKIDKPGAYTWSVALAGASGARILAEGTPRRLIVSAVAAPTPLAPRDGAREVASTNITFRWRGGRDAEGYRVELFKKNEPSPCFTTNTVGPGSKVDIALMTTGTYTWVVSSLGRMHEAHPMTGSPWRLTIVRRTCGSGGGGGMVVVVLVLLFSIAGFVLWMQKSRPVSLVIKREPAEGSDDAAPVFTLQRSGGPSGDENRIYLSPIPDAKHIYDIEAEDCHIELSLFSLSLITQGMEGRKVTTIRPGTPFVVRAKDGSDCTLVMEKIEAAAESSDTDDVDDIGITQGDEK